MKRGLNGIMSDADWKSAGFSPDAGEAMGDGMKEAMYGLWKFKKGTAE